MRLPQDVHYLIAKLGVPESCAGSWERGFQKLSGDDSRVSALLRGKFESAICHERRLRNFTKLSCCGPRRLSIFPRTQSQCREQRRLTFVLRSPGVLQLYA